ncbi:MAG: tetratricopeptide repeat protein, partial [Leptospirales bacterium]
MAALRDALRATPGNVPLRLYIAEVLRKKGDIRDSEQFYREGLRLHPGHEKLKLGLAQCFYAQKRYREALVLVEDLPNNAGDANQSLLDLHIRLLALTDQRDQARSLYDRAVVRYPSLSETDLPELFGWPAHVLPAPATRPQDLMSSAGPVMVPRTYNEDSLDVYEADIDRPPISFRDVGGLEDLKEEIRMRIVFPLRHPEVFEAYGRKPGGALLMYGPPGCGKTHLARAAAGEIQAAFISIGINDVLEMWL